MRCDIAIGLSLIFACLQLPGCFECDAYDPHPITWIPIPAGTFQMGCSCGDSECQSDELPRHDVLVSAFEMLESEVTQAQMEIANGEYSGDVTTGNLFACDFSHYERPAASLSWEEAGEICKALGGRLPTEAEWEYAARGGTTTRFYCGDDPACLPGIAWVQDPAAASVSNESGKGKAQRVKQKAPNAFGLYDMLGNVREYTSDYYDPDYYSVSSRKDPRGPVQGKDRACRGGDFMSDWELVRVSSRSVQGGGAAGVRCVRDVEP